MTMTHTWSNSNKHINHSINDRILWRWWPYGLRMNTPLHRVIQAFDINVLGFITFQGLTILQSVPSPQPPLRLVSHHKLAQPKPHGVYLQFLTQGASNHTKKWTSITSQIRNSNEASLALNKFTLPLISCLRNQIKLHTKGKEKNNSNKQIPFTLASNYTTRAQQPQ